VTEKHHLLSCSAHDFLEVYAIRKQPVRIVWWENGLHTIKSTIDTFTSRNGIEHLYTVEGTAIPTAALVRVEEHFINNPMQSAGEAVYQQLQNLAPIAPLFANYTSSDYCAIDLSKSNSDLAGFDTSQPEQMQKYIENQLATNKAKIALGGYGELRDLYAKEPNLFGKEHPRCIHLGLDCWTTAGTSIHAPIAGKVIAAHNNQGNANYGATLILEHEKNGVPFFTLYGHLSLASLLLSPVGKRIEAGEVLATLGTPEENGNWAPHLHFQIMADLMGNSSDFPGVTTVAERAVYLSCCPDPMLLFAQ